MTEVDSYRSQVKVISFVTLHVLGRSSADIEIKLNCFYKNTFCVALLTLISYATEAR